MKLTGAGELGSEEVDWIGAVNSKENSRISTIEWVCTWECHYDKTQCLSCMYLWLLRTWPSIILWSEDMWPFVEKVSFSSKSYTRFISCMRFLLDLRRSTFGIQQHLKCYLQSPHEFLWLCVLIIWLLTIYFKYSRLLQCTYTVQNDPHTWRVEIWLVTLNIASILLWPW